MQSGRQRAYDDVNARLQAIRQSVIHFQRRFSLGTGSHDARRHADSRGTFGDITQHNASGSDLRTRSNFDIPKDLRTGANQNAAANLRMSITTFPSRPAQCHVLEHGNIVFNNGGLPDD
jgi:hypothetical protein